MWAKVVENQETVSSLEEGDITSGGLCEPLKLPRLEDGHSSHKPSTLESTSLRHEARAVMRLYSGPSGQGIQERMHVGCAVSVLSTES